MYLPKTLDVVFPSNLFLRLLIISVGVGRRPSFILASALEWCRVNWSKETMSPSTESTVSLSPEVWRGGTVELHAHTTSPCHTVSDPSTFSPVPPIPPPPVPPCSLRKGAVLSGILKPCLYCQRSCQHLPPLEHLVPSCWVWTENSTIWSLKNCYFWDLYKHIALYRLSLQSEEAELRFFFYLSITCFIVHCWIL